MLPTSNPNSRAWRTELSRFYAQLSPVEAASAVCTSPLSMARAKLRP